MTLFRSGSLSLIPSFLCSDVLLSGAHLLAMLQRKTSSWGVSIQHVEPSGAWCDVMHAK